MIPEIVYLKPVEVIEKELQFILAIIRKIAMLAKEISV